jgi:sodium transport system permease protein
MLPLFLVIMVALGCFIPAIDSTAGERERSTWETTLTLAASRRDIVVAKYLYVATLGLIAGLLNVAAMFVSMGPVLAPMIAQGGVTFEFALPPLAFPVMALGAFALALFFAAAMMILAAFARTFKEGQGMVTPVYFLGLIPVLLGQGSEVTLTPATAAIPVGNVAMMMRDAVRGVFQWPLIGETMAVSVAALALCLMLARSILRFEEFLTGAYEGSFLRFVRERVLASGRRGA